MKTTNKKTFFKRQFLIISIIMLIMILVNLFVFDHCNQNYFIHFWANIGVVAICWILEPLIIKDPNFEKEDWKYHCVLFLPVIVVVYFVVLCLSDAFYKYHGVSIIRIAQVDELFNRYEAKASEPTNGARVHYKYKDNIRHGELFPYYNYTGTNTPYVRVYVDCHNFKLKEYEYRYRYHYPHIHDFAFLDDTTFYTYHDFSLIKPDLVYYQVGFNVLYNAVCDTSAIADSTAFLSFDDVCGKNQIVKYSVKGYPTIPDTFLIYRNVNEKIDSVWHVCAPEVNTPENRAKISDYGYIFHYDVYSKQEIESQCPRIKEYVEQYKKRITPLQTNNL